MPILISFVMPSLNEEKGIRNAIRSVPRRALQAAGFETEILIVDGGSSDRTVSRAQKAGARVITSPRGYGRQYKKGFEEAQGSIIVTGDSDGTYPFGDAPAYIDHLLQKDLEFITINRFGRIDPDAMGLTNRIGNWGLTLFTNLLFWNGIKDSQSGMWIIKKDVLPRLTLVSDGMPFSQEIKIEAFRKLRSAELPGSYCKRIGESKLERMNDGVKNLCQLLKKRIVG